MVKIMQVTKKIQRGPLLRLIFSLADVASEYDKASDTQLSERFMINDLAQVGFQFIRKGQTPNIIFSLQYKKQASAAAHNVKINVTCEELKYEKQFECSENFTTWITIGELKKEPSSYDVADPSYCRKQYINWGLNVLEINVTARKVETITFPKLYEDDEFCDFHLKTADGTASVPVHKACLAIHSDMFRRMLHGEWKETINGCLKIEGASSETIKHLKEFFYLGTLPDSGMQLQLLLLLGKCYMVKNLIEECVIKMAETVEPEELFLLHDFAVTNQIPELSRAILQFTPDRTVHIAHILQREKEAGPSNRPY